MSSTSHVISDKQPTEFDRQQTQLIIDYLRKENVFSTPEEDIKREEVLAKLHVVIDEWVKECAMKQVCFFPPNFLVVHLSLPHSHPMFEI